MALRASYYGLKKRILDKVLGDYDTAGVMTNKELTELNKQLNSGLITTLDAFLAAASKPESGNLIYVSGGVVSILTDNELSASGKLTVFNLTGGTFDWYGMIGAERFACGRLSNNQYSAHTIIK